MNEAKITINGVALTSAQAMTIRVACAAFDEEMRNPDALGDAEHGRRMTAAYLTRLAEIIPLLLPALGSKKDG